MFDRLLQESGPLLWKPVLMDHPSAWYGHVPFAHWLVTAIEPRTIVELGTHSGVSYTAFCNAVANRGLSTKCFAIDTWLGDEHAGHYDDKIYQHLKAFNDARYSNFSSLLRCTFDEGRPLFVDQTIDLLHIDGLHTLDAVSHDFETWKPKLSARGVVLFHDTNERRSGFGVWQFWEEVRARYPSFEFFHSHGLGIACVGDDVPRALMELCALDEKRAEAVRGIFEAIGERWRLEAKMTSSLRQAEAKFNKILGSKEAAFDKIVAAKDAEAMLRERSLKRTIGLLQKQIGAMSGTSVNPVAPGSGGEMESRWRRRLRAFWRHPFNGAKRKQFRAKIQYPTELWVEKSADSWVKNLRNSYRSNSVESNLIRVSVVMPTFNRKATVGRAIESVFKQSYQNWELIVVDDGSTDGTAEMLRVNYADPRVKLITSGREGVSSARNKGLNAASGTVIAYLDSDNEWKSEYLELMLTELERTKAWSVYSIVQLCHDGINQQAGNTSYRAEGFDYNKLLNENYIDLNVYMHRRELFEKLGGFDVNLKRMVDWDLILRYSKDYQITFAGFVGAKYDNGPDGSRITKSELSSWQCVIRNRHWIDWSSLQEGCAGRDGAIVSIIICVYNQWELTEKCVNSLLSQEAGQPFEIILVDNGSEASVKKGLEGLRARDNRITILYNNENYGFALGNNLGFAKSRGEIVVFLNNDTEVSPEWLRSLVRCLEDPSVKGAQPKLVYPNGLIQCVGVVFSERSPLGYPIYSGKPATFSSTARPRNYKAITAACMALRARDFISVEGFDPIFVNGQEDVDLCLRLGRGKAVFRYAPDSVVIHHEGRSAGRGAHIPQNRAVFCERWAKYRFADDQIYYREDEVSAQDYFPDKQEWVSKGQAVWRPSSLSKLRTDALDEHPIFDFGGKNIAIKIGCPRRELKEHWGDYHFAVALAASFIKFGINARIDFLDSWSSNSQRNDINLVLRGLSKFIPRSDTLNFVWLISHPDKTDVSELSLYDHVFVASTIWGDLNLRDQGVSFEPLLQCTDPSRFYPMSENAVFNKNLFVANSRRILRKVVERAIAENVELSIYGEMWEGLAPKSWVKGELIANIDLPKYYSGADVVLNDHWETMRSNGFVSNRIFDALACGAVVVTDEVAGLPEDLLEHCIVFGESRSLSEAIKMAQECKAARSKDDSDKLGSHIAREHSFDARALRILMVMQRYMDVGSVIQPNAKRIRA
jgi:glycosyltransferase involved in cell wall biosynthesis